MLTNRQFNSHFWELKKLCDNLHTYFNITYIDHCSRDLTATEEKQLEEVMNDIKNIIKSLSKVEIFDNN